MVNPAIDAALLVGAPVLAASAVGSVSAVKFACADRNRRAAMRKAWAVRRTWSKTAVRVGLFQTDKSAKVGQAVPLSGSCGRRSPSRSSSSLRWWCGRMTSAWSST